MKSFRPGATGPRPLESVRGQDIYVLQCLHATPEHGVDERLNRMLFMIGALKDASAARVTSGRDKRAAYETLHDFVASRLLLVQLFARGRGEHGETS